MEATPTVKTRKKSENRLHEKKIETTCQKYQNILKLTKKKIFSNSYTLN